MNVVITQLVRRYHSPAEEKNFVVELADADGAAFQTLIRGGAMTSYGRFQTELAVRYGWRVRLGEIESAPRPFKRQRWLDLIAERYDAERENEAFSRHYAARENLVGNP